MKITDEQINEYRQAYYAQMHAGTAGPDQGNAIRAGLAAAYVQREREIRAVLEGSGAARHVEPGPSDPEVHAAERTEPRCGIAERFKW